jgi:putative flavoprotein involved in K+ transport
MGSCERTINDYLAGFKRSVGAPLREGVEVQRVAPLTGGGFLVRSSAGECAADQVVAASGAAVKSPGLA